MLVCSRSKVTNSTSLEHNFKQGAKAGSLSNFQHHHLKPFPNLLNASADLYVCSNPCTVWLLAVVPCLFYKVYEDNIVIFLLNYVDDLLYYGTNQETIKIFEEHLYQFFDLQLMGQSHWYFSIKISQMAELDIIIDQTHYGKFILKWYLDTIGHPYKIHQHNTPLPLDFIPIATDRSATIEDADKLSIEFNLDSNLVLDL
jgi:hypothetical protein